MVTHEQPEKTIRINGTARETPLATFLRGNGALNISTISRQLGMSGHTVRMELQELVVNGLVEVIQPLGGITQRPGDTSPRDEIEFYRWRRRTDSDHAWQPALYRHSEEHTPRHERRIALLLATG